MQNEIVLQLVAAKLVTAVTCVVLPMLQSAVWRGFELGWLHPDCLAWSAASFRGSGLLLPSHAHSQG